MTVSAISWTPLEPGQLTAMRIAAALVAVAGFAAAVALDVWASTELKTPFGWVTGLSALPLLYYAIVSPARRVRRWGYARTEDELHVAHGFVVRTETSVAFHRVQHIDIEQGPIERLCGVCQLVLNTSGTHNSRIRLPGLSRATAEALRDEIRLHVRSDKE